MRLYLQIVQWTPAIAQGYQFPILTRRKAEDKTLNFTLAVLPETIRPRLSGEIKPHR